MPHKKDLPHRYRKFVRWATYGQDGAMVSAPLKERQQACQLRDNYCSKGSTVRPLLCVPFSHITTKLDFKDLPTEVLYLAPNAALEKQRDEAIHCLRQANGRIADLQETISDFRQVDARLNKPLEDAQNEARTLKGRVKNIKDELRGEREKMDGLAVALAKFMKIPMSKEHPPTEALATAAGHGMAALRIAGYYKLLEEEDA